MDRVVLNALGDRRGSCCLIFAPSAIDLSLSSEKPFHVPSKSNGRPGEVRSRGARLWVFLWRNLTHR